MNCIFSESACMWSEHVIRSFKPSVPSLRSKLFQVYSSTRDKRTCRLCSWSTLTDPTFGYIDHQGWVTLSLSLDMDTHVNVHILTDIMLKENSTDELFNEDENNKKTMHVAKNIRLEFIKRNWSSIFITWIFNKYLTNLHYAYCW